MRIEQLPSAAKEHALEWLKSFHFTELDLPSLRADGNGGILYVCPAGVLPADATAPEISAATVPVTPFPSNLVFHSKPDSPNVLFINFAGETVINTEWNTVLGRAEIPAVPFSSDTDLTTFSDAEQTAIKRIWQRMAEDYAPFDIDVTTERPATFTTRTAQALITRTTDANGALNPSADVAGGIAYVNVFGTVSYAKYRPAWIYHNNLGNQESYIAEAASHEIGHNLGLSHDGKTDGTEYYGGHGTGDISWGPLMGTGYGRNVSQWSKGEYYLANNTQDDLATIGAKVSYRVDDHGNTAVAATPLVLSGGTNVVCTTPETDPSNTNTFNKGILERNTDVDVFSLVTGDGTVKLNVNPWIVPSALTRGGNLDLRLELYSENGVLLATNNPALQTTALIQTNLAQGRYYLHVRNSGAGAPLSSTPSGYTSYGSLGEYFITGYVVASTGFVAAPLAELHAADIAQPGVGPNQFTVAYSDDVAVDVSTLDSKDIRVIGPNGYDRPAQFVSVDLSSDGTPRVATYAAPPPNGIAWLPADNGTYAVSIQGGQVGDIEGAWVAEGKLGEFKVAVPISIYSANMDANPAWTLELDWQYGSPSYLSGGPTTGYTGTKIIGYNLSGDYPSRLSMKYATTPSIDCSGSTSLTLRFRRWLRLKQNDTASIEASTDGIAWTTVWSTSSAVSDTAWNEVLYPLPAGIAGRSSVRLRWGIGSNPSQTEIGWNIDDVELLGDGVLDTKPPLPYLSVADVTIAGSPSHSCTVTYTDDSAVRLASIDSTDLVVTGPNGYSNVVEFVGVDLPSDGSPCVATYSIPAPGGVWDEADDGLYSVVLQADAVQDIFNNATPSATLGSFTVALTASNPGTLTVSPEGGVSCSGSVGGPFTPSSVTYTLSNSGGTSVNWTASKSQDWVSLSATGGTLAPGASTTVTVATDTAANSLAAGAYSDTVFFANTSSGNGNTSRSVTLTVNSPGVLVVSPAGDLTSSGLVGGPFSPSSVDYTLSNSGGTSLNWKASKSQDWVSLSATSGTLAPGTSMNVTVSLNANADSLLPGNYYDTVVFANVTTGMESTSRSVDLSVTPKPGVLTLVSTDIFAATGPAGGPFLPENRLITLTNSGGSSLLWSATVTNDWLSLSADQGLLGPGESTNLLMEINTRADTLSPGDYQSLVTFEDLNAGAVGSVLEVNLTVTPNPTVELNVSVNNPAWGSVDLSSGAYTLGSSVTLLATPALYYEFVNWGGDATGTDNPLTLLLDTNRSVLVVFGEILTTNYPTPHWWLAANGYTNDFEEAVVLTGANQVPLWQSYIAGLNPNDPQSQLRITAAPAPEGVGDSLSWNALPDRLYTLWWSTNPVTGFVEVPGGVGLPGTVNSFTNAPGTTTTQRFYRLEVKKY